MSQEIYEAAKKLLSEGCSVIPIKPGTKAPLIEWSVYQERRPTEEELEKWFVDTDNQLGLVTGNVSDGRFILDFDGLNWEESFHEFEERFPEIKAKARIVVTGSGRLHVYGKCQDLPSDLTRKIKRYYDDEGAIVGEVELRCNRHQSLVPPSKHPSGAVYSYLDDEVKKDIEISLERFNKILAWIQEGQKAEADTLEDGEDIEADQLTPEHKTKLADYYLKRILRQVLINRADRNNKGYELARELNNLRLSLDEAKPLMRKFAEEVPQWIEKDDYTEGEAMNSLKSAFGKKRESPWIPWGFLAEFEKEKEIKQEAPVMENEDTQTEEWNLEYPKDAIRGFAKDFADTYSEYLESPYPFWIFNCVTALGSIFAPRVKLNTSLYTEGRFYTVILGTSGITRKSESGRQTINFNEEAVANYEGKQYDNKGQSLPSQYFNALYGCGSAEGLMDRLELTPNLLLVYDELRSFVQKCDIKGSNLLQVVNSLFESNHCENAVKGCYRKVENVHLSLLAFCTTETWTTLFSPNFIDIGFINRLWIVPGEAQRKHFKPEAIPTYLKDLLKVKFNWLMDSFPRGEATTVEMDVDAELFLDEWYRSFAKTEFTRRLDGYGLRLLLVMAISENKKMVDVEMAERCVKLLEWQKHVREAYQPADYTDRMSQIENLIREAVKRHPRITKGRLLNAIHAKRFDSWKVNKSIENLIKNGEMKEIRAAETSKYLMVKSSE